MAGWVAIIVSLAYVTALFAVAHFGDTRGRKFMALRARPAIYALSLAVYCTSWTFFGSVGIASAQGLEFLAIYLGPVLVFVFGRPLILRIVRLAKAQNSTSIADFVAARYGKSQAVAALVAVIAVIGAVPYIALQLKAVSASLVTILSAPSADQVLPFHSAGTGVAASVAIILAFFAMAFGTRRIEATEHQDGLILAVAVESLVKLLAFLAVGVFVIWWMYDGFGDLTNQVVANPRTSAILDRPLDPAAWLTMTVLSASAILLLPRQFHVTVVENRDERDVLTASWLFPLYLVAINFFVLPIAMAGLLTFPDAGVDRDMMVLLLPLQSGADIMALVALIGGLSAATAMVIVASVAISIMVSNDLVMPLLLRGEVNRSMRGAGHLGSLIVNVRRLAIALILGLAFFYYRSSGEAALASMGLLSFAAVAQIGPAFFGGMFWSRATARGAGAGLIVGIAIWSYTLLLPTLDTGGEAIASLIENGPLGVTALRPTALLGLDWPRLTHGTFWSLAGNISAFVIFSLLRRPNPMERMQASLFIGATPASTAPSLRLWRGTTTIGELQEAVARYLGNERTNVSFESFLRSRGIPHHPDAQADMHLVQHAEHLLASGIGAASSRLVLSLLFRRGSVSKRAALQMLDDASSAILYNRDLLQHALDHARQGITVFDKDLRLLCWNREFCDLFDLPASIMQVGVGMEEILRFNAERGLYGQDPVEGLIASRLQSLLDETEPFRLDLHGGRGVIETRSARMPDGGLVTTYTDVTETVAAERVLAEANESLERRVRERTFELTRLNEALAQAKKEADEANLSKTRFLAAASHDILQPLNAARLYTTTLLEKSSRQDQPAQAEGTLVRNVDASLEAVEEILASLLEISRLDAGAMKAEEEDVALKDLFDQLRVEFELEAQARDLRLSFVPTSLIVRTDRKLLRRLLQNLVSNAIKYTPRGRVLVGCRRRGDKVRIMVLDTGLGIPADKQAIIFQEFQRLDEGMRTARGLGLGLSIVERLARVLDHAVALNSTPGRGSAFSIDVRVSLARRATPPRQRLTDTPLPHAVSGMVILAVDNDPRIVEGMRGLLEGWGCTVITCAGRVEAISRAGSTPKYPDVVVADYHLDDGDGLTLIEALRVQSGWEMPGILVTADRTAELRERAAERKIAVLVKPLRPAALRALLSRARSRIAAERPRESA